MAHSEHIEGTIQMKSSALDPNQKFCKVCQPNGFVSHCLVAISHHLVSKPGRRSNWLYEQHDTGTKFRNSQCLELAHVAFFMTQPPPQPYTQ